LGLSCAAVCTRAESFKILVKIPANGPDPVQTGDFHQLGLKA
jgi:hypothetical protein